MERVLVVIAHPDDAEFWVGGVLADCTARGTQVTYVVLTDGDAGGYDPDVPRGEIPRVRRAEQRGAAAILGVKDIQFLGMAEGSLTHPNTWLHAELVRAIRRTRPQRLITWSPEWNWSRFRSCHPDHLATGTAALRAVYPDAGNRFAIPMLLEEGLEPWTVPEIWLFNSPSPNHHVEVGHCLDQKVSAVAAHASQIQHPEELEASIRQRLEENAAAAGLPLGSLVELFQVVQSG
ncbi:PIG-L deacetylase family protein [Catellatospora sichuanensis]|uniref:PIG-L deacetylase family protein n=1 Tax=Catellatospora sichuanensis TaxID=1969805 RepID=UPI001C902F33|nr:PIG-L deacetylase family protein [Catellatospora sichuanensis]